MSQVHRDSVEHEVIVPVAARIGVKDVGDLVGVEGGCEVFGVTWHLVVVETDAEVQVEGAGTDRHAVNDGCIIGLT